MNELDSIDLLTMSESDLARLGYDYSSVAYDDEEELEDVAS